MKVRALFLCFVLGVPVGAAAVELKLPAAAQQTSVIETGPDRYRAPTGVFSNGALPNTIVEGSLRKSAWKLNSAGLTPLQVIRPLRDQLVQAQFEILLDCAAEHCGGFDFRFATETLPGPEMYVNIRAYHFITAQKQNTDGNRQVVTVLASSAASAAYIQIIEAGGGMSDGASASSDVVVQRTPIDEPSLRDGIAGQLMLHGHANLADLDFETGTTDLGKGPFASLAALSVFLKEQPDLRVALVGHTDTVGSQDGNITISRRRARSVRARLVADYGIAENRLDAQGMGYLAPLASNLTPEGREQNRRVEVILLSDG